MNLLHLFITLYLPSKETSLIKGTTRIVYIHSLASNLQSKPTVMQISRFVECLVTLPQVGVCVFLGSTLIDFAGRKHRSKRLWLNLLRRHSIGICAVQHHKHKGFDHVLLIISYGGV